MNSEHVLPGVAARVVEHLWGSEAAPLLPPFDVIIACGMQPHTQNSNVLRCSFRSDSLQDLTLSRCT